MGSQHFSKPAERRKSSSGLFSFSCHVFLPISETDFRNLDEAEKKVSARVSYDKILLEIAV